VSYSRSVTKMIPDHRGPTSYGGTATGSAM